MSALDQAFLQAYAKNRGQQAPPASAPRAERTARRAYRAKAVPQPPPARTEDVYADGTWYRLETDNPDQVEPEVASPTPGSVASRRRKRLASRAPHVRFASEAPVAPPPTVRRQLPPSPPPLREAEPVDELPPPSAASDFVAAYTVAIAGAWEQSIDATGPAKFVPQLEPPAKIAGAAKAVVAQVVTELPTPPVSSRRLDPPEPVAVAKPHFALAEEPQVETAPVEEQPAASAVIPVVPEFEPAWEVERFSWPAACGELLASALDDWGLAVRQLIEGGRQGCKTLAIAGLRRGEGRSTLALCLARLAAQTGAQIALVDADFENPQLANHLGVGTDCDWRTALADGLPLAEASIVCLADRLTLIPLQHPVPFKQTSFGRPGVSAMLKSAAAAFDLVLVDAGPIAGPEYLSSWGGSACPFDGVLLVRDLRRTDAEETAATLAHLRRSGRERIVVLENFAGVQPGRGESAS